MPQELPLRAGDEKAIPTRQRLFVLGLQEAFFDPFRRKIKPIEKGYDPPLSAQDGQTAGMSVCLAAFVPAEFKG